jgi:hypothetical protein
MEVQVLQAVQLAQQILVVVAVLLVVIRDKVQLAVQAL